MPLQDTRRIFIFLCLLGSPSRAESAATADEDAVISPPSECRHYGDKSWTLTREAKLSEILKSLAELTCERFFVPRALLGEKLTVDVGKDTMSTYELHSRVEGALRAKGIVLETAPASRVRRSSDAAPTPYRYSPPPYHSNQISVDRLDKAVKCVNNQCTLTRDIVDAMLADSAGLATSARIVPSIKDGKPNGLKLFAIRPNSYFARLGLENGDTIVTLAGYDIASPDKALEAYTHLRGKNQVKVELLRRGEKMTIEYIIK